MISNVKMEADAGKKVVTSVQVSISDTFMSIPIGITMEYSIFDFAIENARTIATYLKKKGRGEFKISRTSPTTFNVERIK